MVIYEPRAAEQLTALEGFAAMLRFLEAYWKRGGELSDEIAVLLSSMSPLSDGMPFDQALWDDWLQAIDQGR